MKTARFPPRATRTVALLVLTIVVIVATTQLEWSGETPRVATPLPSTTQPSAASTASINAAPEVSAAFVAVPATSFLKRPSPHLVIKHSPATITGYDGKGGTITFDHAALMALNAGDYVVSQLGEHTIIHRVYDKEVREDHVYMPMDVVDPMTGEAIGFHGAYHAYEGGTSYYFNSEHGGFKVLAEYGKPTTFTHFVPTPEGEFDSSHGGHAH